MRNSILKIATDWGFKTQKKRSRNNYLYSNAHFNLNLPAKFPPTRC
jgi:hypothetical protein